MIDIIWFFGMLIGLALCGFSISRKAGEKQAGRVKWLIGFIGLLLVTAGILFAAAS